MRGHQGPIAVVLGTRPEIIKLGHVIRLLGSRTEIVHTGQHYDAGLSGVFFTAFGIEEPATSIAIGGKTRGEQIGTGTVALTELFARMRPRAVVVQGDTNSTLAAALAANAEDIPLIHVEAGLRSHDRAMPEEHNRVLTDHLADLCLAPTEVSHANLVSEGIPEGRIRVTGNTVVEAVTELLPEETERESIVTNHGLTRERFVLSTFHRPENVDDPDRFAAILHELQGISMPVVLPLHPRSRARLAEHDLEHLIAGISVIEPVGYREFLALLAEAAMAVGDSGGVQEEVSVLKRPMIVVRRSTERPEVMGTFARLCPAGDGLADMANGWLADLAETLRTLSDIPSPYGNGSASDRSVAAIDELLARDDSAH
ncbi:MAG: UDP-N-acetylglucosamine 2-epimerase (non-hydrolyzing) [Acidimicrobiia bacterium]